MNRSATGHLKFRVNNSTEAITVLQDGKVGIGTTNPSVELDVVGNAKIKGSSGDGVLTMENSAGSQRLRIDQNSIRTSTNNNLTFLTNGNSNSLVLNQSTNNVGIGTNSPDTKLEVAGGADAIARITGTTTAARLDLKTNSHHRFWQTIESDGRFRLYNQTTGAEQLTVLSGGNVGIGTTNPDLPLSVAGSIQNQAIFGQDRSSGVSSIYVGSEASSNKCLAINYDNTNNKAIFNIGGDYSSSPLVIDDGRCKVGIGTTGPASVCMCQWWSATIPTLSASHPFTISNTSNSGMSIISGGTTNAGQIVLQVIQKVMLMLDALDINTATTL